MEFTYEELTSFLKKKGYQQQILEEVVKYNQKITPPIISIRVVQDSSQSSICTTPVFASKIMGNDKKKKSGDESTPKLKYEKVGQGRRSIAHGRPINFNKERQDRFNKDLYEKREFFISTYDRNSFNKEVFCEIVVPMIALIFLSAVGGILFGVAIKELANNIALIVGDAFFELLKKIKDRNKK